MGSIVRHSRIEQFRLKRHGKDSRLRFLADDQHNAGGYEQIAILDKSFYVTKGGIDTNTGDYRAKLSFNRPNTLDISQLLRSSFIDLILENGTRVLRYSLVTENPPTTTEDRWYYDLVGAFNDKTPIAT